MCHSEKQKWKANVKAQADNPVLQKNQETRQEESLQSSTHPKNLLRLTDVEDWATTIQKWGVRRAEKIPTAS